MKHLILFLCLLTLGSSRIAQDATKKRVKITQKSLLGTWYTGPGTKYNVDHYGKVLSVQPLPAQRFAMNYEADSTMWHDGHQATLTWMVFDGNRIVYDRNTKKERIYKVEIFTKDSMQVFGPFTKEGKRYDPTALFRLVQYR